MGTPSIRWVDSGPTSPIQWIYREWVWEQGLSEGYNNKTWLWVDWITRTSTKMWNSVLCPHPRSLLFLLILLQCFVTKVSKIIQIATVLHLFWRTSYIIYPFSVDPDPPFVNHASHFSSACPISCLPKPSVSCNNQSSTVQGSFPH